MGAEGQGPGGVWVVWGGHRGHWGHPEGRVGRDPRGGGLRLEFGRGDPRGPTCPLGVSWVSPTGSIPLVPCRGGGGSPPRGVPACPQEGPACPQGEGSRMSPGGVPHVPWGALHLLKKKGGPHVSHEGPACPQESLSHLPAPFHSRDRPRCPQAEGWPGGCPWCPQVSPPAQPLTLLSRPGDVLHPQHAQGGHGEAVGWPDRPRGLHLRPHQGPAQGGRGLQVGGGLGSHHH